jgi:hypothetical protein
MPAPDRATRLAARSPGGSDHWRGRGAARLHRGLPATLRRAGVLAAREFWHG